MVQNNVVASNDLNLVSFDETYENFTIIQIDNKSYAIKTKEILEIIKLVELDKPEGTISCILGIMHFKNEPVGVIDLREVFKKQRITYNLNTKVIIMQNDSTKIAIVCDSVLDMKKFEKNKIYPANYQSSTEFFEGVYLLENENIYIINIKKIVDYISSNSDMFPANQEQSFMVEDEESKKILKSRREALVELDNAIQPNISLYDSGVSFLINNVKYYINMASVKEFYKVNKSKFIKIPCTKDYIFGLINIKGEYIVVIDIKNLFYNSKTTIKEKSTIIILNSQDCKIGVLADEICESMNIDFDEIVQSKLQKNDDNKMTEFVKDDEIYQVLDIEQLLKDERLLMC